MFPFFYRVSTRPVRPMFKNKKPLTLTLPLISHSLSLSLSLSLSHFLAASLSISLTATSHLPLLPHSLSPLSSPSQPLHHLRFVIHISTRLPLLPHDLSTTFSPPFRSGLASFFSFTASPSPPLRFDLWFDLVFRFFFFSCFFQFGF